MIADLTRKPHYTLKHQSTTCHCPALRVTHDMDAFCHNDMRVDSSDKNWAPTQNHWYAISLLNFDLWIDKPLLQACLRSLVSYERCTNCSSIHKTIVLGMCALVKRATSDAMTFQALRTWCFIRDEKWMNNFEVHIQHGQCINIYKYTYLQKNMCTSPIVTYIVT